MTVTGLVAVAGTILVGFFGVIQDADQTLGCSIALVIFALFCIFLPPNVLIHECGHLCFGALFGMQFVSVSVSRLQISKQGLRRLGKRAVAGEARMLPRNENKIRLKSAFYSIGGAVFNLIYGAVFLVAYSSRIVFLRIERAAQFIRGHLRTVSRRIGRRSDGRKNDLRVY